jgi:hypothetical protein
MDQVTPFGDCPEQRAKRSFSRDEHGVDLGHLPDPGSPAAHSLPRMYRFFCLVLPPSSS